MFESDEDLRKRIAYCVMDGGGERLTRRIQTATGVQLDALAQEYDLRRLSLTHARYYHGR